MGYAMDSFSTLDLGLFALGTFAAAFVTGLAGFAFGIIAAAVWLHFLSPMQAAALIVAFGLIVQGVSRDQMATPPSLSYRGRHRRADRASPRSR